MCVPYTTTPVISPCCRSRGTLWERGVQVYAVGLNHHHSSTIGYWVAVAALSIMLALASLPLLAGTAGAAGNQANWRGLNPASSPAARENASAAFNPTTGNIVLFGGQNADGVLLNDTYVWNGSTWKRLNPSVDPAARENASMAFNPTTGNIVLFGGQDADGKLLNDTYVWNGTNWNRLNPSVDPTARENATMAFNPTTGNIVLFGGQDADGTLLSRTYIWTVPVQ